MLAAAKDFVCWLSKNQNLIFLCVCMFSSHQQVSHSVTCWFLITADLVAASDIFLGRDYNMTVVLTWF